MRLSPIQENDFSLPDDELGRLILEYWIAGQAEADGLDPWNLPQAYVDKIIQTTRLLPDDCPNADGSLLLVLRLAANGKFEAAGKKLKGFMSKEAQFMAAVDMVSSMDEDTKRGVKVRRSARLGHEAVHGTPVEQETTRRNRLDLLDEIRRENPALSNSKYNGKVYKIAAAKSIEKLGKKTCSKTFKRTEEREEPKS